MTFALIPDSGSGSVNFIELGASYIAPLHRYDLLQGGPAARACSDASHPRGLFPRIVYPRDMFPAPPNLNALSDMLDLCYM